MTTTKSSSPTFGGNPESTVESAFARPAFRWLTAVRFTSTLAIQIQGVVIGWQVYSLTQDPLYLGLVGLAEAIPALSLALFSGDLVDRRNPLHTWRAALWTNLLASSVMLATTIGGGNVGWLYLAAVLTGIGRSFIGPSVNSLVPRVVPKTAISASSAWITGAFQIATITGPALGGFLYAASGPWIAYAIALTFWSACLGLVTHVDYDHSAFAKPANSPKESVATRLAEGVRFVFSHPILLPALALDMFAVLFGGATALLPIFAKDILAAGPTGLGVLRASPAFGALLMTIFLVRRPVKHDAGKILLRVVAGFGACMIGFALSKHFWLSCLLLALSGALDAVSMVLRSAIVLLHSPEHLRGRIAAVNAMFIGSSNELGAFESGVAAKLLGTVPSVVFGGCVTLVTVAVARVRAPRLHALDLSRPPQG